MRGIDIFEDILNECLQIYLSPSWQGVLDTTFKMSSNISIPLMVRCT
jgi:hypothetical protein